MEGIANFFREVARGSQTRQAGMLDQQNIYMQQDYRRGQADKALTEARIARDTELQRLKMEDALTQAGVGQAGLFSNLFRSGGGNVDQVAQALGQFIQNDGLGMAREAAKRGDMQGMNLGLALNNGKPVQTTSVSDGVAFNQFGLPSQTFTPTPVGSARMNASSATAGASAALKSLREAQTETAGARTSYYEAKGRREGAEATIAEGDAAALNKPVTKPTGQVPAVTPRPDSGDFTNTLAKPEAREGQLPPSKPSVEASGTPPTIRADIADAVKRLGAARAATTLDLPNIATQEEYDALPPGAYFFDPVEGTVNLKPK